MRSPRALPVALVGLALSTLVACGTSPVPDFRGRWKPANAFAEEPQAIPLRPVAEYAISPADLTLKSTLERWAIDAGATLRYEAPVDYTLHAAASGVSAQSLAAALQQLEAAYARQGLRIRLDGRVIDVSAGDVADVSTSPSGDATSP